MRCNFVIGANCLPVYFNLVCFVIFPGICFGVDSGNGKVRCVAFSIISNEKTHQTYVKPLYTGNL